MLMPLHDIAIMVLFLMEANIDVILAEASMNTATHQKIALMMLPAEAIIDVATRQSYYQGFLPWKLSLPFQANINVNPVACHTPPWKLSSMP